MKGIWRPGHHIVAALRFFKKEEISAFQSPPSHFPHQTSKMNELLKVLIDTFHPTRLYWIKKKYSSLLLKSN